MHTASLGGGRAPAACGDASSTLNSAASTASSPLGRVWGQTHRSASMSMAAMLVKKRAWWATWQYSSGEAWKTGAAVTDRGVLAIRPTTGLLRQSSPANLAFRPQQVAQPIEPWSRTRFTAWNTRSRQRTARNSPWRKENSSLRLLVVRSISEHNPEPGPQP